MYLTHIRPDEDTTPPTKWGDGSVSYPEWLTKSIVVEVLIQFDYDTLDGFNTVVKANDQYFMMMSIDLE